MKAPTYRVGQKVYVVENTVTDPWKAQGEVISTSPHGLDVKVGVNTIRFEYRSGHLYGSAFGVRYLLESAEPVDVDWNSSMVICPETLWDS